MNRLKQEWKIDADRNSAITRIDGRVIDISFAEEAHSEIYPRVRNILFSAFAPEMDKETVDAA